MAEDIFKKHRDAIKTWSEFVATNRQRGMADREIESKLRSNKVDEEAVQLLMTSAHWKLADTAKRKDGWKIAVGILKMLAGIFFLFIGNVAFGAVLIAGGFVWIGSYVQSSD